MRWFAYIDNKIYGPYSHEQLTPFLQHDTRVAREGQETWMLASEDPELRDVLSGNVRPAMEWHVSKPGKPFRGPFTRQALFAMIERKDVEPRDLILHESWKESMPLGQTRLYAKWQDPSADLSRYSAAEIRDAPRPKSERLPAPPRKRSRTEIPRGGGILIALAVLALIGYGIREYRATGSRSALVEDQPIVKTCGGPPSSGCSTDKISECVCKERPKFCGCGTKGACGMKTCAAYGRMLKEIPPPSAMTGGK